MLITISLYGITPRKRARASLECLQGTRSITSCSRRSVADLGCRLSGFDTRERLFEEFYHLVEVVLNKMIGVKAALTLQYK